HRCGHYQCATGANRCDSHNRCQCDPGRPGNGRTKCARNRCICSSVDDPHITLFDAGNPIVTVNLQCTYQLARLRGGGPHLNCKQGSVYMETEMRGTGNMAYFLIFASKIKAVVVNQRGKPRPSTVEVGRTTAGTPNADGFITTTTNACDLELGYNEHHGAVYLSGPGQKIYIRRDGMCGDCDGRTNENPGTTAAEHLTYALALLAPPAQQQSAPYRSDCVALKYIADRCQGQKLAMASSICYPWISRHFGLCLLDNDDVADYPALLASFRTCLRDVCRRSLATACTNLANQAAASAKCSVAKPAQCP
ncbi:hypothetical protein BaRGS_00030479, partial [Batillaria attramentaria]